MSNWVNTAQVVFLRTLVREGGYDSIVVFLHSLHLLTNAIDNPCQLICLKRNKKPCREISLVY